jgi:YebC/PmpR family DNA-binding regulatory protein
MSGHSKWSTIKRAKGAADIKRGLTFTKIANAISICARVGGNGNPDSNPRLRMVLESARKVNMPKENIQRAIDRGLGKLPGQTLEEVLYEGFGPGKAAFLIEGVTDNKLRTNQEVKHLFERAGGVLGGSGSTAYMFDKVGEIRAQSKGGSSEEEMLTLIDLGAGDVEEYRDPLTDKQAYLIYVESPELNTMSTKVTQAGFEIEESEIVYKPNIISEIKESDLAEKVMNFTEKLEEMDDIQKVWTNFEIDEAIL